MPAAAAAHLNNFIAPNASASAPGRSFLSRLLHRIHVAQTRRAEQEVARIIQAHGGRFTDSLEREIERTAF